MVLGLLHSRPRALSESHVLSSHLHLALHSESLASSWMAAEEGVPEEIPFFSSSRDALDADGDHGCPPRLPHLLLCLSMSDPFSLPNWDSLGSPAAMETNGPWSRILFSAF